MLKPSSSTVKIFWLDSMKVMEKLKRVARQMKTQHPEIERVLLFGSLSRGEAVPGSDADLLLILSSSDLSFLERIAYYLPLGLPLDVDVFPYTQAELTRMCADGNLFIQQALAEGVPLTS
jgi:predicted nucleotidyltransferase